MNGTHALLDMKAPQELIQDLGAHLDWSSGDNLLYEAAKTYRVWVLARLRIWEAATANGEYRRVKALAPSAQQRLLLAPEFFRLLQETITPDEQTLAALNNYIEVEELLAGGAGTVPKESWSALGDICLAPADGQPTFQKVYEAPRAENIVIDARSPHFDTNIQDWGWGRIGRYSEAEISDFHRKVVDALAFIRRTSANALATVDASEKVLVGVNTLDKPRFVNAASMKSLIGRIAFTNGYSDAWQPGLLIDTLVHESIHSLIFKLELMVPLHTDFSAALSLHATSPWTGRSLTVRTFVHACFVWYGLQQFWALDESELGRTYYTRARQGFLDRSPMEALSKEARELIQPYVCDAIEELYHRSQAA